MIMGCPSRTSSDILRADLGVHLLSSRRDIVKLKWQHRLKGLPTDRLERVLYDRGQQAPVQARHRSRCMWSQAVGAIWGTLSQLSMESMSMPRKEYS